jgi:hypothetical protein
VPDASIYGSLPLSLNSTDDSWVVRAAETGTNTIGGTWYLVVTAVCATVGS